MRKLLMLAALAFSLTATAQTEELAFHSWAPTPPMGWNSFDCHGSSVKEHQVMANAKKMKSLGMLDKGWNYVVVDIRWFTDDSGGYYNQTGTQKYTYDEYGRYMPDVDRFPVLFDLPDGATRFTAFAGLDDTGRLQEGSTSSIRFFVYNYDPTKQNGDETTDEEIPLNLEAIGIGADVDCEVYDIWGKETVGTYKGAEFKPTIARHGCGFYRVTPKKKDGIKAVTVSRQSAKGIYSITGQRLSHDIDTLPQGLYIVDGEKIAKR